MKPRWFPVAGVLVLLVLVWVTRDLLTAQDRAQRESDIRAAHFRMNSRVAILLERERERSPQDYEAFAVVEKQTYSKRDFRQIEKDELLTQSALLESKPEFIQLHFQIDPQGRVRSPQVPQGNSQELAVPAVMSQREFDANCAVLETVKREIDPQQLGIDLKKAQQRERGAQQGWFATEAVARSAGSLEPLWIGERLYFVRKVKQGDAQQLQGFVVDWPALREALLAEVADLFPEGALRPHPGAADDRVLYALPAQFLPGPTARAGSFGREHVGIALMWGLVLLSFVVYARTLRRADEQRRFAGHVTHELRSPLTTFSLYSDLLAEGLLKDESKKEEYLRTLQSESQRMGHMIENVIAQARLEEGRTRIELAPTTVGALLRDVRPSLERLCEQHGLQLSLEPGDAADATVRVDGAAVGRILTNLVENSCKYGRSPVTISAAVRDGTVRLYVRDHGDGIGADQLRRIFRPYDRGGRDETDAARGLGLGLPLSRELARRMQGDLTCDPPDGPGARFTLTFPA